MRNSLLPLIGSVLIGGICLMLVRGGVVPGADGPELFPGLFRIPKHLKDLYPSDAAVVSENRAGLIRSHGQSQGLEPDTWSQVVVCADDRAPATASVVYALAEELTQRGAKVIVHTAGAGDAIDVDRILRGADRLLRIATASASDPSKHDQPFTAEFAVTMAPLRFPDGHPAAALQPASGITGAEFTLSHRSTIDPAKDRGGPRPSAAWWAAVGRGAARAILSALAVPAQVSEWTGLAHPAWGADLPQPPQNEVVRWFGAVQFDLVRGWVGEIRGTTTTDSMGRSVPAIEPFERLLTRGGWTRKAQADDSRWEITRSGYVDRLSAHATGTGWELTMWQEELLPAARHATWLQQASSGGAVGATARQELRRHLLCPGLPETQRQRAAELLAIDPDPAEAAMLVEAGVAVEPMTGWVALEAKVVEQRAFTQVEVVADEKPWPALRRGEERRLPTRPVLIDAGTARSLLLVEPGADGEAHMRAASDPGVAILPATGTARIPLGSGEGELVVVRSAEGMTVTWR